MNLPPSWTHILSAVEYAERLRVPLRWWVQVTMLVASFWLALIVAVPTFMAWLVTGLLMALSAASLLTYGSARITVADGLLHAGRASIPVALLRDPEPLDAEGVRRVAGVDADARAYLLLRPYITRGLRVWVDDPVDPTPYWMISTRHPHQLATTLARVGTPPRPE